MTEYEVCSECGAVMARPEFHHLWHAHILRALDIAVGNYDRKDMKRQRRNRDREARRG